MIKSQFGSEPKSEKEVTAFDAAKVAKSEDAAVKAAAATVRGYSAAFKEYANAEKALAKKTEGLAAVVAADVAAAVAEATASTVAKATARARKVWTQAMLAEGIPLRTAQRWLSSLESDGEPVFPRRDRASEPEFNLTKSMEKLVKSAGGPLSLKAIIAAAVAAGVPDDTK
jgi:hypothetical protein